MSQRKFSDTLIPLEDFEKKFVFRPKIDFFKAVSPWLLAKND